MALSPRIRFVFVGSRSTFRADTIGRPTRRDVATSLGSSFLADLHLHTKRSDGAMSVATLLAHVSRRTPLAVVAITDHDDIVGAIEGWNRARDFAPAKPRVLVGCEVSATWGKHVLAIFPRPPFPTRPLPRFRSLSETVARIRDLGGLAIVPHPATPFVPSLDEDDVRRLHDGGHGVDGIEVCTGSVGGLRRELRMRALALEVHVAQIGSSDAHHLAHVGKAMTEFQCDGTGTAEALEHAIRARTTTAVWGTSGRIGARAILAQVGRAWALKPARELGDALRDVLSARQGWPSRPHSALPPREGQGLRA